MRHTCTCTEANCAASEQPAQGGREASSNKCIGKEQKEKGAATDAVVGRHVQPFKKGTDSQCNRWEKARLQDRWRHLHWLCCGCGQRCTSRHWSTVPSTCSRSRNKPVRLGWEPATWKSSRSRRSQRQCAQTDRQPMLAAKQETAQPVVGCYLMHTHARRCCSASGSLGSSSSRRL